MQYYHPPPPPRPSSGANVIVIVLAVVGGGIVIIGILAVLAISGVSRYLEASKSAEARNTINLLSMDAVSAYEREDITSLAGAPAHRLCASASAPVPKHDRDVSGLKYQSMPSDWTADPPTAGFNCLKFEMDYPQYYQYNYTITGSGKKTGDSYTVEARGDLNGDGDFSSFTMTGKIMPGDTVVSSPNVVEKDPNE